MIKRKLIIFLLTFLTCLSLLFILYGAFYTQTILIVIGSILLIVDGVFLYGMIKSGYDK